jgi:hypothetical protein
MYRRCYPRTLPLRGAALSSLIGLAYNANGLARWQLLDHQLLVCPRSLLTVITLQFNL